MNLETVLHVQATLMLFLGGVVLLAHRASRRLHANHDGEWFAAASACGGTALLLQAERGHWPALVAIVLGNALMLGMLLLLTHAVRLVTGFRRSVLPWMAALIALLMASVAYFTYWHPNTEARVIQAMLAMPVLLAPSLLMLLRTKERAILPATRTFAAILLVLSGCMVQRAYAVIRGLHLQSGASWGGAIFVAGAAVCFLWMDMLRMSAQLESQAMTDPLTGLLNRRAMDLFARRELARSHRQHVPIAVLMIDLDRFKAINDMHGHLAGDEVLCAVADAIRGGLRTADLASRIGGDEFLVLLPDASDATVHAVTARLEKAIDAIRVTVAGGAQIRVAASIGNARSRTMDESLADLMRRSDTALYEQKETGETATNVVEDQTHLVRT